MLEKSVYRSNLAKSLLYRKKKLKIVYLVDDDKCQNIKKK